MASRVEPAERLLDLLIALTHAEGRLTKAQVRASVNGYADSDSEVAFERMFERDKDLLREMGVPIVTDVDPVHEDAVGYRLDTGGYTMPEVRFTAAEIGVLSLAAEVWQDAHLHGSARRGLTKLRAVGSSAEPAAHLGLALRVQGPERAFSPLVSAIAERQAVRFTYRAASTAEVATRHVQPWRLRARDHGWYLVGHDVDRDAPRIFRLSRIRGRVRPTGPAHAFTVPEHDAAAMLAGAGGRHVRAVLAIAPERAAALRARAATPPGGTGGPPAGATDRRTAGRPDRHGTPPDGDRRTGSTTPGDADRRITHPARPDGRDVVVLETDDDDALAAELATYGDAVLVLEPETLRDGVLRRLRAVAALAPPGRPAPATARPPHPESTDG